MKNLVEKSRGGSRGRSQPQFLVLEAVYFLHLLPNLHRILSPDIAGVILKLGAFSALLQNSRSVHFLHLLQIFRIEVDIVGRSPEIKHPEATIRTPLFYPLESLCDASISSEVRTYHCTRQSRQLTPQLARITNGPQYHGFICRFCILFL